MRDQPTPAPAALVVDAAVENGCPPPPAVHDLVLAHRSVLLQAGRVLLGVLCGVGLIGLTVTAALVTGPIIERLTVGLHSTYRGPVQLIAQIGVPIATAVMLVVVWQLLRSRTERRLVGLVVSAASGAAALARLGDKRLARRILEEDRGRRRLARALLRAGHAPVVLRSGWRRPDPITPFDVAFEPLPIDETQPTVAELLSVAPEPRDATAKPALSTAQDAAGDPGDRRLMRAIRRHIALSGGLFLYIFIGIMLLRAGLDAWGRRQFTPALALWSVVLAVRLGLPALTAGAPRQALVVPGGLLARLRGRWRLMDARSGVLLTHASGRSIRKVIVEHARGRMTLTVTRKEEEFLLRAWTSPVPPPSEALIAALDLPRGSTTA